MRLGFIGPCRGDTAALLAQGELLLTGLQAKHVLYLGTDEALDTGMRVWPAQLGAPVDEATFLTEVALLAPEAPAEVLEALLERDARVQRLKALAALPPPPSRAVELLDDRVVLAVHDKAVLDEDDITNATVIVWGSAGEGTLRAIGPRVFLSPGPGVGATACVAVVELASDALVCALFNLDGSVRNEHRIPLGRGAKIGVQ